MYWTTCVAPPTKRVLENAFEAAVQLFSFADETETETGRPEHVGLLYKEVDTTEGAHASDAGALHPVVLQKDTS